MIECIVTVIIHIFYSIASLIMSSQKNLIALCVCSAGGGQSLHRPTGRSLISLLHGLSSQILFISFSFNI